MTLVYGLVRREPIIIMGQILAVAIYVRNLVLIIKNKAAVHTESSDQKRP